MRAIRAPLTMLVVLLALAGVIDDRAAASAGLDRTFGRDGLALGRLPEPQTVSYAGAVRLADGALAAAGARPEVGVAAWSAQGRRLRERLFVSTGAELHAATARREGGMVVVGRTLASRAGDPSRFEARVGVVAVGADLELDARFGQGGVANLDLPGGGERGRAVAQVPGGGVIVGGHVAVDGRWWPALAAVDASGRPEPSFGRNGSVVLALPAADHPSGRDNGERTSVNGLALQPDGRIVAVGSIVIASRQRTVAFIARFLPSGALDPSFAGRGWRTLDFVPREDSRGTAVALDREGAIHVAARAGSLDGAVRFGLARVDAGGKLARSFGVGGLVVTNVGSSWGATAVAVDEAGRIVVGGPSPRVGRRLTVARYLRSGTLDRSFGGRGIACVSARGPQLDAPWQTPQVPVEFDTAQVLPEPDGRIVVAGQVQDLSDNAIWVLARLKARFTAPVNCTALSIAKDRRKAFVGVSVTRPARLALEVHRVTERARLVGRVALGRVGPGTRRVPWDLRVGGRRLRLRDHSYLVTVAVLGRDGRVLYRDEPNDL